ncbi:hypothetical protein GCM10009801_49450 [Streptomyces albiaxialis]|uniref:Iron-containing redox enzyme family protein n=1 Tax=Streptomyces albiaxialis TaxID=329523 RepID=A0ABN2WBE4_9ACTN
MSAGTARAARAAGAGLDARIGLLLPEFRAALDRIWAVPAPARLYPDYLCVTHQTIRASVPLMETALERCRELEAGDPVAAALVPYWRRHIAEEAGHDTWLREDLAAIGRDPDEVWRRVPSAAVAALVGTQYFWIAHVHPVCLLGYVAVLEGSPPRADVARVLSARTGLPYEGFRTLRRHAELDPAHGEELRAFLDGLPLTARMLRGVHLSALHTVRMLVTVFDALTRAHTPAPPCRGGGGRKEAACPGSSC